MPQGGGWGDCGGVGGAVRSHGQRGALVLRDVPGEPPSLPSLLPFPLPVPLPPPVALIPSPCVVPASPAHPFVHLPPPCLYFSLLPPVSLPPSLSPPFLPPPSLSSDAVSPFNLLKFDSSALLPPAPPSALPPPSLRSFSLLLLFSSRSLEVSTWRPKASCPATFSSWDDE